MSNIKRIVEVVENSAVCVCVSACAVTQQSLSLDTSNELTFIFYTSQICFASVSLTFTLPHDEHVIIPLLPDSPILQISQIMPHFYENNYLQSPLTFTV